MPCSSIETRKEEIKAMRRADREVTDPTQIRDIIQACVCCRLGLNDAGQTYIVPLSFGWQERQGRYTLYFHCAAEGRKLDILRREPTVSFEMDTGYRVNEAENACGYSCAFQSVMGTGRVTVVQEMAEKRQGLALLMEHTTGRTGWDFSENACRGVCVLRLDVEELSGKEHL
jgi:nitroimidazol reductase NimA-like FMN-containing flavoprotein (pyridoxamine 5'-phosphate oxidase superfamily)